MLGVGSGSLLKALEMATFTRPAFSFERFATYKTMMFAQMFGLVLGLSLAGGLFIHEAKSQLTQRFRFMDHVDIVQLLQGASSSYAVRLVGADGMPAVLECLLAGIKHVLVLVYGAAGMALLVALICAKCLTEEALADGP
ncbi:hypothetical protein CDD82_6182 [Ophiocordyceps australis]|uniref:Uncharacterized protein n=1 Tax=Ophiocordyceps australis TaxID=1399860 RepID=A0A2C5YXK3_9HYPO|nr:hypothetical protein CDD82_6182 [Ophiocordyceps australis]